jgi:hypothetical protein
VVRVQGAVGGSGAIANGEMSGFERFLRVVARRDPKKERRGPALGKDAAHAW